MPLTQIGRIRHFAYGFAALGFGAALSLIATAGPAGAQALGIATMQPGSLAHTTATAIAKVLKEKGNLNVLVQPTAGESVLIPIVAQGESTSASPIGLKFVSQWKVASYPTCA